MNQPQSNKQSITPKQLRTLKPSIPNSWQAVEGILSDRHIDPVEYQRSVRDESEQDLKQEHASG